MNIEIANPASIPNPPAGEVTIFLDSTNNNILSYKDENGNVYLYDKNNAPEVACSCCCELAESTMTKITCALKDGTITMADFQTFINNGFSVMGASTKDEDGNMSCAVNISTSRPPIPVLGISLEVSSNIKVGATGQATATINPTNASNPTVYFYSLNPSIAMVNQYTGVVTGISVGTTTIIAVTADGGHTASVSVTITP